MTTRSWFERPLYCFAAIAGFAAVLVAAGCDSLTALDDNGLCGNLILDRQNGEDCDGYAGPGEQCGKPSTAAACRFTCGYVLEGGDGGLSHCPPDFKCGLDGICRASANTFSAPQALPITPGTLQLGDVNGDGHTDFVVVEPTSVGVYLGGLHGGFARTSAIDGDAGHLALSLGPLMGGTRADVAMVVDNGLVHAVSDVNGAFLPVIYSSLALDGGPSSRVIAVRATAPYDHETLLSITQDPMAPISGDVFVGRNLVMTDATALHMTGMANGFVASLVAADIDEAPAPGVRTADEFAIVPNNQSAAYVFSISCMSDSGPCAITLRSHVALPGMGATQTFFADVDGDGNQDLVVGVSDGARMSLQSSVVVAHGDGAGNWSAAAPLLLPSLACSACPGGFADVLAIADINGDGTPDVVASSGITFMGATVTSGPTPDDGMWLEGVAADLNSDGRLDVALLTEASEGVDLIISTGKSDLKRLFVGTTGTSLHNLASGDYDGDGAPDLALLSGMDRVSVFFSDEDGFPRTETLQGDGGGMQSLTTVHHAPGHSDDLTLSAHAAIAGTNNTRAISTFHSDGGQLMRTPVAADDAAVNFVTLGHFLQTDRADTLMTMQATPEGAATTLRLLQSASPLGGAIPNPFVVITGGCDLLTSTTRPALVAADIDGDGFDEVVAVSTAPQSGTPSPTSHYSALWGRVTQQQDGVHLDCHALDDLVGNPAPHDIYVADADNDGHPDLIVDLRVMPSMMQMMQATGDDTFAIYYGLGGANAASPISQTPVVYPVASGLSATAVINGHLAIIDGANSALITLVDRAAPVAPWPALFVGDASGINAVFVADVDGDGLDDLVLSGDNISVLFQMECDPASFAASKCARTGP